MTANTGERWLRPFATVQAGVTVASPWNSPLVIEGLKALLFRTRLLARKTKLGLVVPATLTSPPRLIPLPGKRTLESRITPSFLPLGVRPPIGTAHLAPRT